MDPIFQTLIDQNNEVAIKHGATPLLAIPASDDCKSCGGRGWITRWLMGRKESRRCEDCNMEDGE